MLFRKLGLSVRLLLQTLRSRKTQFTNPYTEIFVKEALGKPDIEGTLRAWVMAPEITFKYQFLTTARNHKARMHVPAINPLPHDFQPYTEPQCIPNVKPQTT
jgi:hypothetical protein